MRNDTCSFQMGLGGAQKQMLTSPSGEESSLRSEAPHVLKYLRIPFNGLGFGSMVTIEFIVDS